MSVMRKYWASLAPREQKIVGLGSVSFIVIVLYSLVWAPMQDKIARLSNQVKSQTQDYAWMQQQISEVVVLTSKAGSKTPGSGQPLLTVIDQTAKALKIRDRVKQIQPGKEAGTAKVWFDKVVFEDWLKWLDQVSKRGVVVTRVSITRSVEAPRVNVRLELVE
ncbi:MAG TPA: hypothetical protein DDW55_03815 [Gammaproteobacteria bacterium]|nr:hypothetical protein [Gammaproteobacteria bacterium]